MAERDLSDYNEVAHRIQEFRDKHPDGSLGGDWRMERVGDQTFIAYRAEAYRNPTDTAPGIGCAWELVPGRTPFTRGSELQNAETSAWGRAIIAVGAADAKKGIASRDEVEARRVERTATPIPGPEHERLRHGTVEPTPDDRPAERVRPGDNPPVDMWMDQPTGELQEDFRPEHRPGTIDERQLRDMGIKFSKLGIRDASVRHGLISTMLEGTRQGPVMSAKQLSRVEAAEVLKQLDQRLAEQEAGA